MFSDLAKIEYPDAEVTNKNWHLMTDEYTEYRRSTFHKTKNAFIEPTCEYLSLLAQRGTPVEILRQDNARENKKLEKRAHSSDWKLNLHVEYTGRKTPQRNHMVELAFANTANLGRAMMVRANLPGEV